MATYFPWKEEYRIGIEIIDTQHKYFVSLINKLYESILNMESQAKLVAVVNELVSYAIMHFNTEEKYFEEFKYEGTAEHKEQHRIIREKVNAFQEKANRTGKVESFELVDLLEGWLINHVYGVDKQYVKCFHEHGLK